MRSVLTIVAVIGGLLFAGSSPAFAAKGVKKNGETWIKGVVVGVAQKKGQHPTEISVKTSSHKKKGASASSGAKVTHKIHKLAVSSKTKVAVVKGKSKAASSLAAVHKGQHVVVLHKNGHADEVHIHPQAKKAAPKAAVKK